MKPAEEPHDPPTRQFGTPPYLAWSASQCPGSKATVSWGVYPDDGPNVVLHARPAAEVRAFAAALIAAADRAEGRS
jgi:hypothetical protein